MSLSFLYALVFFAISSHTIETYDKIVANKPIVTTKVIKQKMASISVMYIESIRVTIFRAQKKLWRYYENGFKSEICCSFAHVASYPK